MSDENVKRAWSRIDLWLQRNAPSVFACLAAGASATEIDQVEKHLGVHLPTALVTSLQLHNGQITDEFGGTLGLVDASQLNSCRDIIECWDMWEQSSRLHELDDLLPDAEHGVRPVPWSPKWVPLTYSASGSNYFVDLDPGEGGLVGQIIHASMIDIQRWIAAPELGTWLNSLASAFESWQYRVSEEFGGLVRVH